MSMKKLPIHAASEDQLRAFAVSMQIEGAERATARGELLGLLERAWPNDFILVADLPEGDQNQPVEALCDFIYESEQYGPTTYLKILPTDMPGGKDPAAPSVNDLKLVINRNVLVGVPYAIYEALKNANIGAPYEETPIPGRPPVVKFTDVTNYPLTEVRLPSEAALAAWRKKWGQRELGDTTPIDVAA